MENKKGESIRLNGDMWMIVDVAPATELAEMVAVMLEDEGYTCVIKGADMFSSPLSALGVSNLGLSYVLVPEGQGPEALAFVEENVEDFEGEEAQAMLEQMAVEAQEEN